MKFKARNAVNVTAAFFVWAHTWIMKWLYRLIRHRVRVHLDRKDGEFVLREDCGKLATGGVHFKHAEIALEYVRNSRKLTLA